MRARSWFLLFALTGTTAAVAGDWPEFRGPTRDGISTDVGVPTTWSATENIAWKVELPGQGWSSPVVTDGKVFLTTATGTKDGGDVSLRALCLDARDGSELWNVELFKPTKEEIGELHGKNSLASPTPIVSDGRVYVHFGHMGTAALDLDGKTVWSTTVKYPARHGNGGSPAIVGDRLIFNCDGSEAPFLAAVDLASGKEVWRHERGAKVTYPFSFSTPIEIDVDGERQVVSAGSGFVGAYDPKDGREIWRVMYGEGHSVIPRPIYAHGLLFVTTGFIEAHLLAIDPRGASGDVTASNVVWQYDKGVPLIPSQLVVGNEIYFVSEKGIATCLDAKTGKMHWTERLGRNFSSSPVYAEGRIYFTNEEGVTSVVRAGTEYELLATNELGEVVQASPAVADGAIFLRTQSHLWRIGK